MPQPEHAGRARLRVDGLHAPISPLVFLRTWPGGSGVEVFGPRLKGLRGSGGRRTVFRPSSAAGPVGSSLGTTVAPVPLAK